VAKEMKNSFFREFNQLRDELNREHELNRRSEDRCLLCGNTKLYYEPPLYYCNGQCNGNRIRRNSYFYSGGRNQYHWCMQCYADIKEDVSTHTSRGSEFIESDGRQRLFL
jgi:E1A/CREB-binding protein